MNGSAFVSPLSLIFTVLVMVLIIPDLTEGRVGSKYVESVGNNVGEGLETKKREVD